MLIVDAFNAGFFTCMFKQRV